MKLNLNIKNKINKDITIDKMKAILFKSMLKMQELATINCPVDKGALRWGINIRPTTVGFTEYSLYDNVEYAQAIEFGTDPYVIKVKNKKVIANKESGAIFGKQVMHPGMEAQPFFRPALDQVKNIWLPRYFEQELAKKGNNL